MRSVDMAFEEALHFANAAAALSIEKAGAQTGMPSREAVQANNEMIVKKAVSLAQAPVGNLPAHQTVIDLIAKAVNPMNLALCDALWMPYL